MSQSAVELQKRISRGQQLLQVVSTLKIISALNMAQFEQALVSLNGYSHALALALGACQEEFPNHEPTSLDVLVLGSSQGLVGQFNTTLARYATNTTPVLSSQTHQFWSAGTRMETTLNTLSIFPAATITPPQKVEDIGAFITQVFLQTNVLSANPAQHVFVLFYNRRTPESSLPFPTHSSLLPFSRHSFFDTCTEPWPTRTHPEFIDGKERTIKELVREFLFVSLFRACCESLAAENASRLATMERAEENIHNHLNSLTLTANQLRQDLIDAELFDVVRQG